MDELILKTLQNFKSNINNNHTVEKSYKFHENISFMENFSKTQTRIIGYLIGVGGKARFTELVERTGLSRSTISRNLKALEEMGYVRRIVDSESKDYPPPVWYLLTEKGHDDVFSGKIPFDVDWNLKREGTLVNVNFKVDALTSEFFEGFARARGWRVIDLLKAIVFKGAWGCKVKGKSPDELTEEDVRDLQRVWSILGVEGDDAIVSCMRLRESVQMLKEKFKKSEEGQRILEDLELLEEAVEQCKTIIEGMIYKLAQNFNSKEPSF